MSYKTILIAALFFSSAYGMHDDHLQLLHLCPQKFIRNKLVGNGLGTFVTKTSLPFALADKWYDRARISRLIEQDLESYRSYLQGRYGSTHDTATTINTCRETVRGIIFEECIDDVQTVDPVIVPTTNSVVDPATLDQIFNEQVKSHTADLQSVKRRKMDALNNFVDENELAASSVTNFDADDWKALWEKD